MTDMKPPSSTATANVESLCQNITINLVGKNLLLMCRMAPFAHLLCYRLRQLAKR
jgi:hypothetical protein